MEELIEKYIKLRDAQAQVKEAAKAKLAKIEAVMDKIEGYILEEFNAQGIESARTEAGTAYKTLRTSATVADWPATLSYIQEHNLWDMLERRVSKTAVEAFRDEHKDLPPGINWREEVLVNIRRSA